MEFTQIRDLDKKILVEDLDPESLLNVCKLKNRYIQSICTEDVFEKRITKDFPRLIFQKPNNLTWKQYYFYLMYWTSKLKEDYDFSSNDFRDDPKKYYQMMSKIFNEPRNFYGEEPGTPEYTSRVYNHIMYEAASLGYMDLVQHTIDKGADNIQGGLDWAVYGGHLDIVRYFEKLGADNYGEALDYARDSKRFKSLTNRTTNYDDMIKYIESKL